MTFNPYREYMAKEAGIVGNLINKAVSVTKPNYIKAVTEASKAAPDSKLLKGMSMAAQVPGLADKARSSVNALREVKQTQGASQMMRQLPGQAADYVGHLNKAINTVRGPKASKAVKALE